ncbi:MAG: methyltransferase domain-containing protein [Niabella sp.]
MKPFILRMPDLSKRSHDKELLDDPDIPFDDIRQNMQELNTVNALLGGHAVTLKGFRQLLGNRKQVSVCEIGCGGGDNLYVIGKWCKQHNINAKLTGIDINPHCIAFAKERYKEAGIGFICSDYRNAVLKEPQDIIFNALFCHHFTDEGVTGILSWMHKNAALGFFINDLHRHVFAYYNIKWLTRMFSDSYLVKNDAPLSVLKSFRKQEWTRLVNAAGIDNVKISWEWAFRYLIVGRK